MTRRRTRSVLAVLALGLGCTAPGLPATSPAGAYRGSFRDFHLIWRNALRFMGVMMGRGSSRWRLAHRAMYGRTWPKSQPQGARPHPRSVLLDPIGGGPRSAVPPGEPVFSGGHRVLRLRRAGQSRA